MVGIGYAASLVLACSLWLLTGFGAGFGSLNLITLTQKRVAKPMMGRFMSLIALTEVGFTPISNAMAGLLADWNVTALFVLAGALLTVTALLAAMNGNLRSERSVTRAAEAFLRRAIAAGASRPTRAKGRRTGDRDVPSRRFQRAWSHLPRTGRCGVFPLATDTNR